MGERVQEKSEGRKAKKDRVEPIPVVRASFMKPAVTSASIPIQDCCTMLYTILCPAPCRDGLTMPNHPRQMLIQILLENLQARNSMHT